MMHSSFFASLLVAALAITIFADTTSSGNRQCPGGYDNGKQMNIGRYWYECRDGQVIPKGCLTPDDSRIDIDGTFDTNEYRMQCVMGQDGFLSLTYKACMHKGSEHDVGAQWDNGVAYFTCVKEGNNVRVITLGCVDQGKQMKLDDRVAKGDFIFQCKEATDGTPKMNKVGCMYQGHRLVDGDHFTEGDMMYSCRVRADKTFFEPFACLQREENGASIERKVGCFWVEGQGSNAFEYTCKPDNNNLISKVQVKCVYRASQGNFKLEPGCVQQAGDIAVGCLQDSSSGKLTIQTYSPDQMGSLPGLHKC